MANQIKYNKRYFTLSKDFKIVLQHKFLINRLKAITKGQHWLQIKKVGLKISYIHIKAPYIWN